MRILILVLALGWFTLSAEAEAGESSVLRQQFLEAERALRSGKRSKYERLLGELEEYPLYPYLIYQDLRRVSPARRRVRSARSSMSGTTYRSPRV